MIFCFGLAGRALLPGNRKDRFIAFEALLIANTPAPGRTTATTTTIIVVSEWEHLRSTTVYGCACYYCILWQRTRPFWFEFNYVVVGASVICSRWPPVPITNSFFTPWPSVKSAWRRGPVGLQSNGARSTRLVYPRNSPWRDVSDQRPHTQVIHPIGHSSVWN